MGVDQSEKVLEDGCRVRLGGVRGDVDAPGQDPAPGVGAVTDVLLDAVLEFPDQAAQFCGVHEFTVIGVGLRPCLVGAEDFLSCGG